MSSSIPLRCDSSKPITSLRSLPASSRSLWRSSRSCAPAAPSRARNSSVSAIVAGPTVRAELRPAASKSISRIMDDCSCASYRTRGQNTVMHCCDGRSFGSPLSRASSFTLLSIFSLRFLLFRSLVYLFRVNRIARWSSFVGCWSISKNETNRGEKASSSITRGWFVLVGGKVVRKHEREGCWRTEKEGAWEDAGEG